MGDEERGKWTLAVRLGDRRTRLLYVVLLDGSLVVGSLCALSRPWAALVLIAGLMADAQLNSDMGGNPAEGPGRPGRTI